MTDTKADTAPVASEALGEGDKPKAVSPEEGQVMGTWGYEIVWGNEVYSGWGYATLAEAVAAQDRIFEELKREGWTQPRWWQWWRANDTRRKEKAE